MTFALMGSKDQVYIYVCCIQRVNHSVITLVSD